ncbi:hypothetical protein MalM25_31780 [Planctomycetes bacterium MalM25]|nr:hypothetical protein MalM25_31780 [Planctomycetes bacterium MalM25]
MPTESQLLRDDIVGQQIAGIYRTPWETEPDGFGGCTTYVVIESGVAFSLSSAYYDSREPIIAVDSVSSEATLCGEKYLLQCSGATINEVLVSEYWPGLGLLLSNSMLLYETDFPSPVCSGALVIGPYADKVGQTYEMDEVEPYWP